MIANAMSFEFFFFGKIFQEHQPERRNHDGERRKCTFNPFSQFRRSWIRRLALYEVVRGLVVCLCLYASLKREQIGTKKCDVENCVSVYALAVWCALFA